MRNKTTTAKALLLTSAFFWGLGFLAIEGALNSGWSPLAILCVRGLLAGVLLLGIASFYKFPWYRNKKLLGHSVISGVVFWLAFLINIYGQQKSTVSMTSILTGSYVILTPFIAFFFAKHQVTKRVYFSCVLAFIAVLVISYRNGKLDFSIGEMLLLVSAVLFSLHFLLVEFLGNYRVAFATSGIQLLILGGLSSILMLIEGKGIPSTGWPYVLYLGIMASGFGFVLQVIAQQYIASSSACVILSLESVFGVIGAGLFFNEPFNWQTVVGGGLMLAAIYFLERKVESEEYSPAIIEEAVD